MVNRFHPIGVICARSFLSIFSPLVFQEALNEVISNVVRGEVPGNPSFSPFSNSPPLGTNPGFPVPFPVSCGCHLYISPLVVSE